MISLFTIFASEDGKQLLIPANMWQFSSFVRKNVPRMRKMQKHANYADPHHHILSDALYLHFQTETIILVDGCKFSDKDGLNFTFIWVHDRGIDAVGSGVDKHETSPRGTGTKNTKWRLDCTAQYRETSRVFLNLAQF